MAQLKSLNSSVAKWIKEHVDKNPYCILTPIFTDYEQHLGEIEKKYGDSKDVDDDSPNSSVLSSEGTASEQSTPAKDSEKEEAEKKGIVYLL